MTVTRCRSPIGALHFGNGDGTMVPVAEPEKKRKSKGDSRRGSRHKDRNMVSLPRGLYERVKRSAEANNRPISWELRRLLGEKLDSEGIPPGQGGKSD